MASARGHQAEATAAEASAEKGRQGEANAEGCQSFFNRAFPGRLQGVVRGARPAEPEGPETLGCEKLVWKPMVPYTLRFENEIFKTLAIGKHPKS